MPIRLAASPVVLALALVAALVGGPALGALEETPAEDWVVSLPEAPLAGPSGVRETRWMLTRPPGAPHDRIQLHRYRREGREGEGRSRAALLYLPGTYMNGEAAVTDPRHNLWLHLARDGVEVFALDYRTHFVSPAPVDGGGHGFMREWTLERFTADARAALALARSESGHARVFVAGFSRGATLAWSVACTDPAVAGLVVLDGPFKSATPEAFDFAAAREALLASRSANDVAHGIGWERRERLMAGAAADPYGPALSPGFETIGEELSRVLYDAWRPGALADPVHGVSRVEVLARLLAGYDRWWPAVQNVEGRSLASQDDDPRSSLDDAWGSLEVPVIYFGATNLGPEWILDGVHSAVKSGSADVELHVLEGWGHLDVLVGERARDEVYTPLSAWIRDRSPAPAE